MGETAVVWGAIDERKGKERKGIEAMSPYSETSDPNSRTDCKYRNKIENGKFQQVHRTTLRTPFTNLILIYNFSFLIYILPACAHSFRCSDSPSRDRSSYSAINKWYFCMRRHSRLLSQRSSCTCWWSEWGRWFLCEFASLLTWCLQQAAPPSRVADRWTSPESPMSRNSQIDVYMHAHIRIRIRIHIYTCIYAYIQAHAWPCL